MRARDRESGERCASVWLWAHANLRLARARSRDRIGIRIGDVPYIQGAGKFSVALMSGDPVDAEMEAVLNLDGSVPPASGASGAAQPTGLDGGHPQGAPPDAPQVRPTPRAHTTLSPNGAQTLLPCTARQRGRATRRAPGRHVPASVRRASAGREAPVARAQSESHPHDLTCAPGQRVPR